MSGMAFRCGHPRTPENTAMGRRCRMCRMAYDQTRKIGLMCRPARAGHADAGPMILGEDPGVIAAKMREFNAVFVKALWRAIHMIQRRAMG